MREAFNLSSFEKVAPAWCGRLVYFPTVGSTNAEARTWLRSVAELGEFIFLTDQQTAGRGRLGRSWEAPFASGLLCTLTVPLAPLPLERAYLYTAALALSLQQAARLESGLTLDLKWPNDLLREGRKCCGILAEVERGLGPGRDQDWLALGFGLNTALSEDDLTQAGLGDKATNLTGPEVGPVERESFLAATLTAWTHYRHRLITAPEDVRQEWAERLVTVGRAVRVTSLAGPELHGQAVGVDPSGALLVQDEAGQVQPVQAGDVSVRLADGNYS